MRDPGGGNLLSGVDVRTTSQPLPDLAGKVNCSVADHHPCWNLDGVPQRGLIPGTLAAR